MPDDIFRQGFKGLAPGTDGQTHSRKYCRYQMIIQIAWFNNGRKAILFQPFLIII
jgi:hypothetical protein